MPLYRYECEECGNSFKVLQLKAKENGKEDLECPECGSDKVKKAVSSVGIRFKGSGFYRTDYKGNGNGNGKISEGNKSETEQGADEND